MTGGERLTDAQRRLVAPAATKIVETQASPRHLNAEEAADLAARMILAALGDLGADPDTARQAVNEVLTRWRAERSR